MPRNSNATMECYGRTYTIRYSRRFRQWVAFDVNRDGDEQAIGTTRDECILALGLNIAHACHRA